MPYVITKGGLISMDHLPAHQDINAAIAEVSRLESIREVNNARYNATHNSPSSYRGRAFLIRADYIPWGYKEV